MRNLGYIGIDLELRSAELGVRLGERYWGRGYGTEATEMFCQYLAKEFHLERLCLDVLNTNHRSRRMFEKCGFQYTGEVRVEGASRFLLMARQFDD